MLGQHPQLYGFPELNLFLTATVGELWRLGESPAPAGPSYVTGLLRVVAELEFGVQTEETLQCARDWVIARSHWTTKQVLEFFLDGIQPRTGVEKSPRTSLSQRAIDRALSGFPNVRVLHLTRHPITTLRSFVETHRQPRDCDFSPVGPDSLANLYARIWIRSQELILGAVQKMSSSQALRVRAEDLLGQPDHHLVRLVEWLNIDAGAQAIHAMKLPERSPYARPAPLGLEGDGDLHFQRSPRLRPFVASDPHMPREWNLEPALLARANEISLLLGYGPLL